MCVYIYIYTLIPDEQPGSSGSSTSSWTPGGRQVMHVA